MNNKTLIQALGRVWLIEESAAHTYAEALKFILANGEPAAGLLDQADTPYRANATGQKVLNGEVFVLPVQGVMMKHDFCGSFGTSTMAGMITAANTDPSIKSIVLSISSPGGSVEGTEDFANAIKASKKPVVVHTDKMASAAYWAGSSAREIVISGQTAMVGSIGTMATMKQDSKKGQKEVAIFASRSIHKNRAAMEALEGKPDNYIKEVLDPLNAVFESTVSQNRAGKINLDKEDVLTGKVYIGNDAIKHGLADKIGTLNYAIKRSLQLANTITK